MASHGAQSENRVEEVRQKIQKEAAKAMKGVGNGIPNVMDGKSFHLLQEYCEAYGYPPPRVHEEEITGWTYHNMPPTVYKDPMLTKAQLRHANWQVFVKAGPHTDYGQYYIVVRVSKLISLNIYTCFVCIPYRHASGQGCGVKHRRLQNSVQRDRRRSRVGRLLQHVRVHRHRIVTMLDFLRPPGHALYIDKRME